MQPYQTHTKQGLSPKKKKKMLPRISPLTKVPKKSKKGKMSRHSNGVGVGP